MDIAICCIVKQENLYLRDWVKYYYDMGVKNIILYDNNNINGEYPQMVISDYIASGFVIYKDARGLYRYQTKAYTECYAEYKELFDWIGFLDIDEYWYLHPSYTFETFFNEERIPDALAVYINWICYGDNDKLFYEPKPVRERFKKVTFPFDFESHGLKPNEIKKIFLKCRNDVVVTFDEVDDISFFHYSDKMPNAYLANGEEYEYHKNTYDVSYIEHYRTLSIQEFLCRRLGRGSYADNSSSFNIENVMECFWSQNEWTDEKQKIIDKFLQNYNIIEDNVINSNE